jgi:hypothetical protein
MNITEMEMLIKSHEENQTTDIPYKFPNINERHMIVFERNYNNNFTNPIIVFVRFDVKNSQNSRTYYLYDNNIKIYKVFVIIKNGNKTIYIK